MKPFTLLSHNAFWFQGVPFATDSPPERAKETLSRLCVLYRSADPDVVCLQEIQSRETFEAASERLDMPGCYCRGKDLPQYGGAVFWRAGCGREIHNAHRSAGRTQRMWQTVEVSGNDRRLRICNVHLPSGRQLGPERAARQRLAEIEASVRSCEAGPDLVVGDFNEQPGGAVGECLENHGYADAAVLSGSAGMSTSIGGGRGDYIWVNSAVRDRSPSYEVAEKSALACCGSGIQYLSDHLPLWLTVEGR